MSLNSIICAQLEVIKGYYTGNLISDPISVDGKSKAIENFLRMKNNAVSKDLPKNLDQNDMPFCDISYDYKDEIINYFSSDKFRNIYKN